MRRRLRVAMVVLSLTAFVGACGGGDDDDGEATPTTVATTLSPSTTEAPGGLERLPEVFAGVSGYTYEAVPDADLADIEDDFTSNALTKAAVVGVDARTVQKDGEEVGAIVAIRFEEAAASLPGFADGFLSGVTREAVSSEEITLAGETVIASTDVDDTHYLSWIGGDLALVIVGGDDEVLRPLATGLISANK